MNPEYWTSRWRENRIGFHEGKPNGYLIEHATRLAKAKRVLVPLCGKAEDMAFLASAGHEVVGIELSPLAIAEFFREHGLSPSVTMGGAFEVSRAGPFTVLAGDVFRATRDDVGAVDAFYDRAAIIALPEAERARYVALLRVISQDSPGLIITVEYPQDKMQGPPFSVSGEELGRLYRGMHVELLGDQPAQSKSLSQAGVDARELCYSITPKPRGA